MLLAYVDESYSADWYYMDALIVDGAQAASLTGALDQIVAKASADFGVRPDAELHGFDLFQGSGDWAGLPPRVRIGIYNQAFAAIAKQDAKIVLRGVHRPGLSRRYRIPRAPHEVVLQHLLERIDDNATRLGTFRAGDRGRSRWPVEAPHCAIELPERGHDRVSPTETHSDRRYVALRPILRQPAGAGRRPGRLSLPSDRDAH